MGEDDSWRQSIWIRLAIPPQFELLEEALAARALFEQVRQLVLDAVAKAALEIHHAQLIDVRSLESALTAVREVNQAQYTPTHKAWLELPRPSVPVTTGPVKCLTFFMAAGATR